jgi:hypothetical protein
MNEWVRSISGLILKDTTGIMAANPVTLPICTSAVPHVLALY